MVAISWQTNRNACCPFLISQSRSTTQSIVSSHTIPHAERKVQAWKPVTLTATTTFPRMLKLRWWKADAIQRSEGQDQVPNTDGFTPGSDEWLAVHDC